MAERKRNPKDEVRRSQVLGMLGPGSLVDLPKKSVLMAGLDYWIGMKDAVVLDEPRLVAVMRQMTGDTLGLKVPPTPKHDEDLKGVVAFQFPEWFVSQDPASGLQVGRRARRLITRAQYESLKPKQRERHVPMRFVAACRNGHLQDVEWNKVVHGEGTCGSEDLALVELGVAGDLADLSVRCGRCGKAVVLAQLISRGRESAEGGDEVGKNPLGVCRGKRPWLGKAAGADELCVDFETETRGPCQLRLLVRHASNAYFPTTARVITIPAPPDKQVDVLERASRLPEKVRSKVMRWGLEKLRDNREDNFEDFESVADLDAETLFDAIAKVQGGLALVAPPVWRDPRDEELAAFYGVAESLQRQILDKDFTAYAFPLARLPDASATVAGKVVHVRDFIERVVLVERLREVQALVGFMRIEPPAELIRSEYDLNPRMAKITRDETWRPAIEIRGEGVFVGLDAAKVEAWVARQAVADHVDTMRAELVASRYGKKKQDELTSTRVGETELPYVLVHTLAHLVLIAVALDCGYSASSIRERIYVGEVDGVRKYGFLLYTGTADSEGTLGGLVEVGRVITKHMAAGLELGALCSNDPICAEARHPMAMGGHIHGAACHGCVLTAESSCERRNELLDRRLVLETVGGRAELAFFGPTRATRGP